MENVEHNNWSGKCGNGAKRSEIRNQGIEAQKIWNQGIEAQKIWDMATPDSPPPPPPAISTHKYDKHIQEWNGGGGGGGLVGACIERKQEYMYILYIFCVFSFLYLTSVNSCLFFVLIH